MTRNYGYLPDIICILISLFLVLETAQASSRDQAYRMHNRIAGVPPSAQVLSQMAALIDQGRAEDAAKIAIENPYFYNLSLKKWISSWTNEDENDDVSLNDFTATLLGIIRDEVPFDRALYDDILYIGPTGNGVPTYSPDNNAHYIALEDQRVDLKANLQKRTLTGVTGIGEAAGVMGTRAFGEAFYTDGTNRRALRFTFTNFLCNDFEALSDTTRADHRVRQDVDRSPGGDSNVYRNKCAGCHAGMDGLAGAYAFYDFQDGRTVYQSGEVQSKYFNNKDTFPDGYKTQGDDWINLWITGQNKAVGWNGESSGNGAKSLGKMLASTEAFPNCMAKRVFTKLCLHEPKSDDEISHVKSLASEFKNSSYNMKNLFTKTAVKCMGD